MQDSNIVLQVVKIENTNRKSATHFALCSGLHLRYLIDLDGGAKRLSENISTYSKKLSLLMQFINIIPFPILNLMKLGYFVKAELNKEVETCRQNIQKKHWNMIVGTYDEKQKIVLQCFNASENADFIKIGNAATEKEMNAEISFLQQKRVYSTFDIPQLLGSISRADGATFNIQITKEFVGDKVEPILTQEIVEIYKELSKDKKNGLEFSHGDFAPWNLKRNGVLTPDKVYANAGYKVWWECREGHEWQAVIASRNSGSGCPFCSGKKILVGVNDLEHKFPEVAKDWNYVKNKELGISGPNKISYSSNKKIWWKCYECEYEWQTKVNNRTSKNRTGCPRCAKRMNKSAEFARKTRLKKRGSLLEKQPELCKEWDEEKNKISPAEITCGSNYRAWWFCEKGHHYQAAVSKRAGKRPTGCPYCAGRKILKGFNDMGTRNPQVLCDWNYERNEISPYQISSYSQKKVWWKCHNCGYEWETTPEKKCNYKKSCPKCKISNL